MVTDRQDIERILRAHADALRVLGVRRIGLFGSFRHGEQRADSDVDLIVEFLDGDKTFTHFMELSFLLERLLERRVDLLTPQSLSSHLGSKILEDLEYVSIAA